MKNKGLKNSTLRTAVCAVIAAVSVVLMMLTGVVPAGTYALPCFAGILLVAVVFEYGRKQALLVYIVVSILSLFLAADKESAVFFIMLFGHYPILKNLIEDKLQPRLGRIAAYIAKFLIFNAAAVTAYFITVFLLGISTDEYSVFGFYVPWLFLIIGNIFFIIYDYAVSVMVSQYVCRYREKIFRKK